MLQVIFTAREITVTVDSEKLIGVGPLLSPIVPDECSWTVIYVPIRCQWDEMLGFMYRWMLRVVC